MKYTELTKRQGEGNIPETIDVSLTGRCQLDCAWCWGEDHMVGVAYTADDWNRLLDNFRDEGTSSVVFTGGEPLMVPFLPDVAKHAKAIGLRTTLSTNSILLPRRHETILPYIDDLGLSIDGSTPEMHKLMRPGKIDNFPHIIESALLAQAEYPDIALTLRTVITRPNISDVPSIPSVLDQHGIDLSTIRYKLYQVEPIGPRATETRNGKWEVEEEACITVAEEVIERYPDLSTTLQLYRNTTGRYYQVMPRGNAYGTIIDAEGNPRMIELGNPMIDFDHALGMIATDYVDLTA